MDAGVYRDKLGVVFQLESEVVFLYSLGNEFQAIPIKAVPFHAVLHSDALEFGVSVGV